MYDSKMTEVFYKIRMRDDSSENGFLNWRPMHQLNAWITASDTFTLRALIMAYGWRPFVFVGPRPHCFTSLSDAQDALNQLVAESSMLKRYSVSPNDSLADLFFCLVKGDFEIDAEVEKEIYGAVEICEVMVSEHDRVLASVQDSKADLRWFVSHMHPQDGHLFLSLVDGRVTWLSEDERDLAWSCSDQIEAVNMAKRIARTEGYYAYPIRMPSVAS